MSGITNNLLQAVVVASTIDSVEKGTTDIMDTMDITAAVVLTKEDSEEVNLTEVNFVICVAQSLVTNSEIIVV